jgi:hypothetical protein
MVRPNITHSPFLAISHDHDDAVWQPKHQVPMKQSAFISAGARQFHCQSFVLSTDLSFAFQLLARLSSLAWFAVRDKAFRCTINYATFCA